MLAADIRAFDGTFNNLLNPDWGSAGVDLLRTAPADYADGISEMAGVDRPSAREISNEMSAQDGDLLNDRDLSAMIYAWGQFIDHDLDLTTNGTPYDSVPVTVATGDLYFDPTGAGGATIAFGRSNYDPATGTSVDNPRQQINSITAFLDGSAVYGSDAARALALRTLEGGHLKTSEGNLLPYNTLGLTMDNQLGADPTTLFAAGDVRANENIELTSLQTLFVREHNRLADRYAAANRNWSDEQIYQAARRMVVAELQSITFNEFLPALLGDSALARYRGYNPQVNPGIANEFSTAAYRFGHSMLGADVEFLDNIGNETHDEVELREAFFNPALVAETGIDSILKYLASDPAQEIDNQVVNDVRNFLFGAPGAGGFDLASLNIQRGRDHGLADYNSTRVAYGLKPVTSFAEITSNVDVQQSLEKMYGTVDNIDLWVGGLAEDHARGSSMGPLFQRIISDQFQRLRDGDRFWYQRTLSRSEQSIVDHTSLADIIRMNTTTTNLQQDVFVFHTSISGTVELDTSRDGRHRSRPIGVGGITVELTDLDGNLIASTVTRRDGSYTFENLELDRYLVRITLPNIFQQTSRDPRPIAITRSQDVAGVDFGIRAASSQPNRPAHAAAVDTALASKDALGSPLDDSADALASL